MKKGAAAKKRQTAASVESEEGNNTTAKSSHNTSNQAHCSCGSTCSTKRCGCKKQGEFCGDQCRCPPGCVNKKFDEKSLKEDEEDDGDQEMADGEVKGDDDNKENVVQQNGDRSLEKRKSQDDSSDGSVENHTPKRIKYVAMMVARFNRMIMCVDDFQERHSDADIRVLGQKEEAPAG